MLLVFRFLTYFILQQLSYDLQACWGTLQAKWLYLVDSLPAFKIQNALHTVLIPTSVVITLFHFLPFIVDYRSPDVIATFLSYSFAVLLFLAMLTLGSANRRVGDFSSSLSERWVLRSILHYCF
jgi:hypothetical protein